MSGVRMGERLLQLGVSDARLAAVLAAKVGLSGHAAIAVADEASAARAQEAASEAGVLIDVRVAPLEALPFPDASIDVVVVHGVAALETGARPSSPAGALRECHRTLRRGGRIIIVEPGAQQGALAQLGGLLRRQSHSSPPSSDHQIVDALEGVGFRPVRIVGELDGLRFIEGLKSVSL